METDQGALETELDPDLDLAFPLALVWMFDLPGLAFDPGFQWHFVEVALDLAHPFGFGLAFVLERGFDWAFDL